MTKISYAVTVCDEYEEITKLIPLLDYNKREEDEVIVLWDNSKKSKLIKDFLESSIHLDFIWVDYTFDGHFANWKNKLFDLCTGDYIFQLDADELVDETLIRNLHLILDNNPEVDLFYVPRINIVNGLTDKHIQEWKWTVDAKNRVNYPDYQTRLYKNNKEVKWVNRVHEVVTGFKQYTMFPLVDEFSIYHEKSIEKQEKQNNYYSTL